MIVNQNIEKMLGWKLMKKIMLLSILFLFIFTSSALAIRSWGNINSNYKYDNLKIRDNNDGTCSISGSIINKTSTMKDGVWIKIYAFDIHKTFLWSKLLFFKTIPTKGKIIFSEKIYDCSDKSPYKLEFKVTD